MTLYPSFFSGSNCKKIHGRLRYISAVSSILILIALLRIIPRLISSRIILCLRIIFLRGNFAVFGKGINIFGKIVHFFTFLS